MKFYFSDTVALDDLQQESCPYTVSKSWQAWSLGLNLLLAKASATLASISLQSLKPSNSLSHNMKCNLPSDLEPQKTLNLLTPSSPFALRSLISRAHDESKPLDLAQFWGWTWGPKMLQRQMLSCGQHSLEKREGFA